MCSPLQQERNNSFRANLRDRSERNNHERVLGRDGEWIVRDSNDDFVPWHWQQRCLVRPGMLNHAELVHPKNLEYVQAKNSDAQTDIGEWSSS